MKSFLSTGGVEGEALHKNPNPTLVPPAGTFGVAETKPSLMPEMASTSKEHCGASRIHRSNDLLIPH